MSLAWVLRSSGLACLLVLAGCGGGDNPPVAPVKPAGENPENPEKPEKPEKPASSPKGTGKSTKKGDGKTAAKDAAKNKPAPKADVKPGTILFQGDEKVAKAAEKGCTVSTLYKGVMGVRRPTLAKRPPIVVEFGLKETIPAKLAEEMKAKGVDTNALQDAKSIRDTAKESGTAAMALTVAATEGTGDDAKELIDETWEASAPVAGENADARTDKELDAAFKKAGEKACIESLAMAIDSLALSLIAREGVMAQGLLAEIKRRCTDPNEAFRKKAKDTYTEVAQAVHARALELVKHPDADLRLTGLKDLLAEDPPGEDVLGIVVELVKDPAYPVRSLAAMAVASKKPDAEGVINALCDALSDRNGSIVAQAKEALLKVGSPAFPALLDSFTHNIRNAQPVLEALATKDPETVLEICKRLGDENADVRAKMFSLLRRLGPTAALAVPTLMELLSGTEPTLRASAAATLGLIGAASEPALPALEQAIADGIREARDAKRAIIVELRKAGKNPPPLPVPETKTTTKDASGKTVVVPPPPPKIVKRKTMVLNDGKEIVVESFMKIGDEYRVKLPGGESATYPAADVKEVKIEDVKE